ncbi:monocarboxylate transporter 13-like [Centruroides vittatus]|uniref:monocarboxylate transporter 13-like n=1 Tax=Centruroides vittatus TaxID=120091 RepID=UPI0035100291
MASKCCNDKDGPRWGWVVAFSAFWINMFMFGVLRSAGVFYVALMSMFHCTPSEAAWPVSLVPTTMCIMGPLAGILNHFFSVRIIVSFGILFGTICISVCYFATDVFQITILFGLGFGISIGLTCTLVPILINQYFNRQRATACGICYSGSTVGAFLFPIIVNVILEEYALRGTFLLLGGLVLHGLWGSMLLHPIEMHKKSKGVEIEMDCKNIEVEKYTNIGSIRRRDLIDQENADNDENSIRRNSIALSEHIVPINEDIRHSVSEETIKSDSCSKSLIENLKTNAKIFMNISYLLTTLSYISSHNVFVIITIILPSYAMTKNIDKENAIFLLSVYSISDLIGRMMPGWLSYRKILSNRTNMIIQLWLIGSLLVIAHMVNGYEGFIALTLAFGFTGGNLMVLSPVLVTEYAGIERAAIAFGFSNFFNGMFSLIRPNMIGYIKDTTGTYDLVFTAIGVLNLIAASLWTILLIVRQLSGYKCCGTKDRYYTIKT